MPEIDDRNQPTNGPIAERFREITCDGLRHERAPDRADGWPRQMSSQTTDDRGCTARTLLDCRL